MRAGTQTGIGTAPLSAVPKGACEIARSDLAQAAQVDALQRGRQAGRVRPGTGPVTEACGAQLRRALERCGSVMAAGDALGWPNRRAHYVAAHFGIKADPEAVRRCQRDGSARAYFIPSAILERSGAWLFVYRRHGGNANMYAATKAADAAVIAALEAVL